MTPLFTIASITYNSSQWVKYTIESVLASTYSNFEFIISDDCSTDDTWQIIQSYNDSRITCWRNETNIGEYPNRNKVLSKATGKYIFYIDGDDILAKNSLQLLDQYISFFPSAGMVWGVPVGRIDFAVLPYLFSAADITRLIYFTHLNLSVLGLGETVFKVNDLKAIGGFSYKYLIGDTYIKRKLALTSNVLLVPEGLSFWRRSANQASKKAMNNYRSFIDMHHINKDVLYDANFPLTDDERKICLNNNKISEVKLLISNTLLKGALASFLKLRSKLKISPSDMGYILKKGQYHFQPVADISKPLMNSYHFTGSSISEETVPGSKQL